MLLLIKTERNRDMKSKIPNKIVQLELQRREGAMSAREADLKLLSNAPKNFLDTTHFDTVRFPPPSWARKVFDSAAENGELAYTPYRGNSDVLEKLSDSISSFMGTGVSPSNLILVPGTQAGLFTALSSIVEQVDRVALMCPDYLFNARILKYLGANIGYVPIYESSTNPTPDFSILKKEFSENRAKVLVLSNPNNPTGFVFSEEQLTIIANLAKKYNVIVLIDSLYSRLLHNGHPYTHLASLPGMKNRVITLLGPSKTESLSGYRLGVVVAPAYLMPRLENVLSIIALRAPAYAQHLLSHWLSEDQELINSLLPTFTNLRDMTVKSFTRLPWLKLKPQAGTAYAWPDVSALDMKDSEVAEHLLRDASVLVSPGYQFGIQEQGHFRICYARDEKSWEKALDMMVEVLNNLAIKNNLGDAKI